MLTKLIPIVLMGGLAAKGAPMAKDQMTYFQNYAKISVTQQEITNIVRLVLVEYASDAVLPNGEQFVALIREEVTSQKRDPVIDVFGQPYGYWPGAADFTVASSGPDCAYNTQDDIVSKYQFGTPQR